MPESTLRQATASDILRISRVRLAVRENMLFPGMVITAEAVREAIEDTGRGWVIETAGEIVGFAIGKTITGNIWALFVHPSAESHGYGQRLHAVMVDWLWSNGLDVLHLATDPHTRAHAFYKRLGWRETGFNEDGEMCMELHR